MQNYYEELSSSPATTIVVRDSDARMVASVVEQTYELRACIDEGLADQIEVLAVEGKPLEELDGYHLQTMGKRKDQDE